MSRIGAGRLHRISQVLDVPAAFFLEDLPETSKQRRLWLARLSCSLHGRLSRATTRVHGLAAIPDKKIRGHVLELVESIAQSFAAPQRKKRGRSWGTAGRRSTKLRVVAGSIRFRPKRREHCCAFTTNPLDSPLKNGWRTLPSSDFARYSISASSGRFNPNTAMCDLLRVKLRFTPPTEPALLIN
jgi:hypothetical protein